VDKHASAAETQSTPALISTTLTEWSRQIAARLQADDPLGAVKLAQVILKSLPRHLLTYEQLLQVAWRLKRWEEGEDWGRRLLRADPGNALAWRALAQAAEHRGQRAQAHATWQRAFEAAPYSPEIRAGLSRTALRTGRKHNLVEDDPNALGLNLACLAQLYLRGYRWERAAAVYRQLIQADPRRIDFLQGLLVALWQQRARQEAYDLARHLTKQHPHLLLAWSVLDDLGDADDRALARNPITTMDPDGSFVRSWLSLPYERGRVELVVSPEDAELLTSELSKQTND
jgi:tetratricopeptide (TPR) repeat protein